MRMDPFYTSTLTQSVDSLTAQGNSLSAQLSSGLRVSSADVDPTAAAKSVQLGSDIAANDAYVAAASTEENKLQASDSALGSVVTQLTSALSLGLQGSNGTLSSVQLQAIGQQMSSIADQVFSLANSNYGGSYLFGGNAVGSQPFYKDDSTPPNIQYFGDGSSQSFQTPTGQSIATTLPGAATFCFEGANVMTSLYQLAADFSAGTVSASTASDLSELQAGLTHVSSQRQSLDSSLNAVTNSSNYASTQSTSMLAEQSGLVSADMATVATGISNNETQQKALLSVIGSSSTTNLFDYINR